MTKKKLSQKPSAVASRERRLAGKKEKAEAAGNPAENPAGDPAPASTATIGVQSPEKPTTPTQLYHCPNCDDDVKMTMSECPTCGEIFNWPKGS